MEKLKLEFAAKREAKHKEESEKKAKEDAGKIDPVTKAVETKQQLKQKKQTIIQELQRKAEERKEKQT